MSRPWSQRAIPSRIHGNSLFPCYPIRLTLREDTMISISVTTLLWPLQNGENPYTFLRDLLRNELYPSPSGTIVGLCVAFSIVLAM